MRFEISLIHQNEGTRVLSAGDRITIVGRHVEAERVVACIGGDKAMKVIDIEQTLEQLLGFRVHVAEH